MKYSKEQIISLQKAAILSGDYSGRPDGLVGPLTIKAFAGILAEFKYPTEVTLPPEYTAGEMATSTGFTTPNFYRVPGVKYKTHKYAKGGPEGLVVHYTVSGRAAQNAKNVMAGMQKDGYGCMVMDEDGVIYIPEDYHIFEDAAAHAGTSSWNGISGMNSHFMGMEICNWGTDGKKRGAKDLRTVKKEANRKAGTYQKYTEAQEKALVNFCLWAKAHCPLFSFDNVVGHDEIAPKRKSDPGGSLSKTLPEFRAYLKTLA